MLPTDIKEKDFKYRKLSSEEMKKCYDEVVKSLEDFTNMVFVDDEIEINLPIIGRIAERVDQRKDYFLYYHSENEKIMYMSHEKEMALWIFWICKYKPLHFKKMNSEESFFIDNGCTINEAFATFLMISIVCSENNTRVSYFEDDVVKGLYYDMSNRDYSKEAIISRIEDLIG